MQLNVDGLVLQSFALRHCYVVKFELNSNYFYNKTVNTENNHHITINIPLNHLFLFSPFLTAKSEIKITTNNFQKITKLNK